jgi:hypothetical protein
MSEPLFLFCGPQKSEIEKRKAKNEKRKVESAGERLRVALRYDGGAKPPLQEGVNGQ